MYGGWQGYSNKKHAVENANVFSSPFDFFSSSLSLKCALRESGCRIDYEPTKMSRDPFWRSISRDTNVEISALSPFLYRLIKRVTPVSILACWALKLCKPKSDLADLEFLLPDVTRIGPNQNLFD